MSLQERARTGVKGVLGDHAAYVASVKADEALHKQARAAELQRMVGGTSAGGGMQFAPISNAGNARDGAEDDDDDDDDPDLEDFMSKVVHGLLSTVWLDC